MGIPFGVFVCAYLSFLYRVYRVISIFNNLFLFLKSHIRHGSKLVSELGMDQNLFLSKELCIRLLCVRVGPCCALRRVMQFLPERYFNNSNDKKKRLLGLMLAPSIVCVTL